MPSGYTLTIEIWDYAEPFYGPTVAWLIQIAPRLGIYLGTSFLEVDGGDFYNTFALVSPRGTVAGKVRKSPPASLEAFFYRAGNGSHVIETELGRIGVGICFENLLFERLEGLFHSTVDLVLQPTAASRPKPMRPGDIELFDRMIKRCASYYARTLGVPVALANRTGNIHTDLPGGYSEYNSIFCGLSQIVDSDGRIKAKTGEVEGVLVAEVELNPARKRLKKPRCYGKMWAFPMPWFAFIWPETQHEGEQDYQTTISQERTGSQKRTNP
jgi:N-carbamoylputrescine amidase